MALLTRPQPEREVQVVLDGQLGEGAAARRDVHEWLVALGGDFPIPDEIDNF